MDPYFTVLIPWVAEPKLRTQWHPTTSTGPFSTLTRGSFKTEPEAQTWAREHLGSTPFSIVRCPSTETYSKEIVGEWHGVKIPSWLRAFDCRAFDHEIAPLAPWGSTLWGSERAQVDLGLRTATHRYACTPTSCSTYVDARTADPSEIARQVTDAIAAADKIRVEYEQAKLKRAREDEGGSVLYLPVAIALSNFGWSVICDERTRIVRRFGA